MLHTSKQCWQWAHQHLRQHVLFHTQPPLVLLPTKLHIYVCYARFFQIVFFLESDCHICIKMYSWSSISFGYAMMCEIFGWWTTLIATKNYCRVPKLSYKPVYICMISIFGQRIVWRRNPPWITCMVLSDNSYVKMFSRSPLLSRASVNVVEKEPEGWPVQTSSLFIPSLLSMVKKNWPFTERWTLERWMLL